MNKITIINKDERDEKIVSMRDMPLGSIGMVVSETYNNTIVRRTCIAGIFLVEDLSTPGKNKCWENFNNLQVKLLPDAEIKVII